MRKYLFFFGFVLASVFGKTADGQTIHRDYHDGQVYFRLAPSVNLPLLTIENLPLVAPQLSALAERYGFQEIRKASPLPHPELQRWYRVTFEDAASIETVLRKLGEVAFIEYAERVPYMRTCLTPNDPQISAQWHLNNISAPTAWDLSIGNPAIRVAIVDDAVKITHQDLAPNLWVNPSEIPGNGQDDDNNGYIDDVNGWDCSNNDNNPNPPASATNFNFSHGTHCAGIAAGATNNSAGIASISWNVKYIPVKCKPDNGTGAGLPDVMDGVQYAMSVDAEVISMSWGGGGFSAFSQQVFTTAHNDGIVLVAAAGNDNVSTTFYPAGYQHVIAVGSTNSSNQKSGFSNYGTYIDVMAPGSDIRSTVAGSNTSYTEYDGTSMACPMVAGLCALMLSYNPNQTPDDIENCLEAGCDNIDAQNPNYVGQMGAGRINARNALACSPPPITDHDAAITGISSPVELSCSPLVNPVVTLTNIGQLPLTSVTIRYKFDNGTLNTYNWIGNLANMTSATVSLPGQTLAQGNHTLTVYTQSPNGQQDQNVLNDQSIRQFLIMGQPISSLPFTENFESNSFTTNGWNIQNPDGNISWEIVTAGGNTPGTKSARVNCYNYNSAGQRDGLISRPIDLTNYGNIQLTWNYAYRRYSTDQRDSLLVYVSTNCGDTWTRIYTNGGGTGFATGTILAQDFVPAAATEWCSASTNASCTTLNLNAYANQTVILKFETYNDYGNNIYLDDINLTGTQQAGPNFNAGDVIICPDEAITFTDASTNSPTAWEWQFPGGTPSTSTAQNPTVTYTTPGIYDVTLTLNGGASTITKSAYVTVVAPPMVTLTATDTTLCAGNHVDFSASGALTYAWGPSASGLSTLTGPTARAYPLATTTYYVTGTDAQGCSATDSVLVEMDPWMPTYSIQPVGGQPLTYTFADNSAGSTSWQWNFGDGGFSFNQSVNHTYAGAGTYLISLIVSNGTCTVILNDTLQVAVISGQADGIESLLRAYPNPTTGSLSLELPAEWGNATATLLELSGRTVREFTLPAGTASHRLDLSNLPAGTYALRVEAPGQTPQVLRIVRQ